MTKPGKQALCFPGSGDLSDRLQVFSTHICPASRQGRAALGHQWHSLGSHTQRWDCSASRRARPPVRAALAEPRARQEEYNKNTVFQELLNKEESMLLAGRIQRYNSVCRFSSPSEATLFVHAFLKWKVFPLLDSFQRKI